MFVAICPHCTITLDSSARYITCPHCGRITKTVDECVEIILSSGQMDCLIQKATSEYWKTITTGLKHIMFMDEQTCLEVMDKLFSPTSEHAG